MWGGKVDNLLSHIIRYCTRRQGYIYVTTHEQLGRHPSVPMNYNEAPPGPTKHHQAHSFGLPGERWGCLCVALAVPVFANQRKDFAKRYEQIKNSKNFGQHTQPWTLDIVISTVMVQIFVAASHFLTGNEQAY